MENITFRPFWMTLQAPYAHFLAKLRLPEPKTCAPFARSSQSRQTADPKCRSFKAILKSSSPMETLRPNALEQAFCNAFQPLTHTIRTDASSVFGEPWKTASLQCSIIPGPHYIYGHTPSRHSCNITIACPTFMATSLPSNN